MLILNVLTHGSSNSNVQRLPLIFDFKFGNFRGQAIQKRCLRFFVQVHTPFLRINHICQDVSKRDITTFFRPYYEHTNSMRLVLLSAPLILDVLDGMASSFGTSVHVVNCSLVVLEQLRALLFICWSNQITVHVKWHWFKMYSLYEFKTFELLLFSYF